MVWVSVCARGLGGGGERGGGGIYWRGEFLQDTFSKNMHSTRRGTNETLGLLKGKMKYCIRHETYFFKGKMILFAVSVMMTFSGDFIKDRK